MKSRGTGAISWRFVSGKTPLSYVTALRSSGIQKLVKSGAVDRELFDEENCAEITNDEFPGERLVVCLNPYLRDERRATRKTLLASAEKKLGVIRDATLKAKNPLTGELKIAMKVGKIFAKNPLEKHFLCTITATSFSWTLNAKAIADEERLDGIYVIRTNVPQAERTRIDAVGVYKRLTKVERAFRCMKLTDLAIRPVYHFRNDRVITYVFLCMLA